MDKTTVDLLATINDLHSRAAQLWQLYLDRGPGQLSTDDLAPFLSAVEQVRALVDSPQPNTELKKDTEWTSKLEDALTRIEPLLRRCVERSEGLCFVTGEAGLIPRKDLHNECDEAILQIKKLADEMSHSE